MKNRRNQFLSLMASAMVLVTLVFPGALAKGVAAEEAQAEEAQLVGPWGELALTFYGAEEGKWSIGGALYMKRLLLVDPEAVEGPVAALYISEDNTQAVYAVGEAVALTEEKHMVKLSVNGETDLVVMIGEAKVVIVDGAIVENEADLPFSGASPLASNNGGKCVYMLETGEAVTIAPYEEGGAMDVRVEIGEYSAELIGNAASMTLTSEGDMLISGAEGEVSLDLALNQSAFSFVTISGTASGDIAISSRDRGLQLSGALVDYTIENMTVRGKISTATASGEESVSFAIEGGKIVAYADHDGDGVFETKLDDAE